MSDDKKKAEKDVATPTEPKSGKGKTINLGLLPPDHPVYSTGLIISGRKVSTEPEQTPPSQKEEGKNTVIGYLPSDHRIFSRGPTVAGRPIYTPPAKKKEE